MPTEYWCGCSNVALSATVSRVEHRDVGLHPFAQHPAIGQPDPLRGKRRHLPDRVLERDHFQLAHVAAEHAREGAVAARMRAAPRRRSEPPRRTPIIVAGCRRMRCRSLFADRVEDRLAAALLDDPQRRFGGVLDGRLEAAALASRRRAACRRASDPSRSARAATFFGSPPPRSSRMSRAVSFCSSLRIDGVCSRLSTACAPAFERPRRHQRRLDAGRRRGVRDTGRSSRPRRARALRRSASACRRSCPSSPCR